jgi:drug/metabolite transporter (DMT)-like permease
MPQKLAAFSRSPIGLIVAAYLGMVLIWGTTWLAIKFSLLGLPPFAGAGVRFLLAGALMYAVALAMRVDLRRERPPLHLVVVLALTLFGVNYGLTYYAETHLSSGIVAVVFGTQPFFTFALAFFLLHERIGPLAIAGALLAFAGVALISLGTSAVADVRYLVATLLAALISAFAQVYLKRFSRNEPLATLPPAMLLAGAGLCAWGAFFEHPQWSAALAPAPLAALLYLAIAGSAIAFYLNHWLLQRISSGAVGLSALLIPVIAVAVGAAFGGERFTLRELAGAVLVIAGMWLSLRPPQRRATALELGPAA